MRVVIDGIPVRVSWKHNKHMYLYISPTEGVACVTAPIGAPMQRIERFVRKKRDWIEKQQKKYRESKLRQEKLDLRLPMMLSEKEQGFTAQAFRSGT